MAISDFADVELRHQKHIQEVASQRRSKAPLKIFLRGMFAVSRLFGFEPPLFQRFCKPLNKALEDGVKRAFNGYEPTEHDVFVCVYMKSGTNWMMQVVHQIANRDEGEFDEILNVVAWPDSPSPEITIDINDPRPAQFSPTGLRAIKTHAPADYVPYNDKAKYLCVVRDPKDVAVSAYHFFRSVMLGSLMPTIATWVKYLRGGGFGPWADFTSSYWAWRDRSNVLFLTYEEINEDTTGAILKIAALMNVELTDEELAKVVKLSSFEYMKGVDHKFYPGELTPFADGGGRMVRRGQHGVSGEILSTEQQGSIDEGCREGLGALDCDFPFEQHYGGKV